MKYKKTKLVNYRQQKDNLNILETCTFIDCDQYRTNYDRHIDITRQKRSLGIQYKHENKEDIAGFISKPVARPEYGMICHDLKEILWVPNFYYICQICYLRLGLRSSGFPHD